MDLLSHCSFKGSVADPQLHERSNENCMHASMYVTGAPKVKIQVADLRQRVHVPFHSLASIPT